MTVRDEPPPPHGPFDEAVLRRYSETVHATFDTACRTAGGCVKRFYRIGNDHVMLQSPEERVLERVGAALEHLRIHAADPPDLTISLWDGAGVPPAPAPPSPWGWYAARYADGRTPTLRFNSHGELAEFRSPGVLTAFRLWPHKLRVVDLHRRLAFYWTADIDAIPDYEYCAPLRKILAWWASARGAQIVHAAAVGLDDGGVLLAGKGGAGKSTTALACLGSPLKFAGDDCCLIHTADTPRVGSLYSSAKLKTRADVARFPHLTGAVHNSARPDGEKAFMFLHRHRPAWLSPGFPIRALLIPRVTGIASPRLVPVSAASGLAALAPSTLSLFPGLERESTRRMAELVARVPCYRFEVGPELRGIPDTILHLLERLR